MEIKLVHRFTFRMQNQMFANLLRRQITLLNVSIHWCKCFQSKKEEIKGNLKKVPQRNIRNFGIIAHVDHGKSTLSDRLMEFAGNIHKGNKNQQILDSLQVERERGITVKAQTVSLFCNWDGENYLLNLIDTPGHVDFSYEVSRSLAACQGVILLVDANQGVQAQTVANFNLAFSQELKIIPVVNKIDLKNAKTENVCKQLNKLFGFCEDEVLKVSAKLGTGVEDVLKAVVQRIPPPPGDIQKPVRALLYDSWYSQSRGVICLMMVVDGAIKVGEEITSCSMGCTYEVKELGILYPEEVPVHELLAGQAGYVVARIKNPQHAIIGDTWFKKESCVQPLPTISSSKPVVFAGIYPSEQSKAQELRKAIEKLLLNDSSVKIFTDNSPAFGKGWRLGFLGLLHMEVFCQRLDLEYNAQVIITAPGVPYKIKIKGEKNQKAYGGEEICVTDPVKFPDPKVVSEYFEPMVLATIITPTEYYSEILKISMLRRGEHKNIQSIDDGTMMLVFKFPMSEIIIDFFNELKTVSSGFASFDYEEIGYESSYLKKVDILLIGKIVDEFSVITHASLVQKVARSMCLKLKESIEPHLFLIAIQACVGGKVIARENIKPVGKNVTAKLYGGDVTRRMKLIERQKQGKKHMRVIGNIQVSRKAFIEVLKR